MEESQSSEGLDASNLRERMWEVPHKGRNSRAQRALLIVFLETVKVFTKLKRVSEPLKRGRGRKGKTADLRISILSPIPHLLCDLRQASSYLSTLVFQRQCPLPVVAKQRNRAAHTSGPGGPGNPRDPLSPTLPCGREEITREAGVSEGSPFTRPLIITPWSWVVGQAQGHMNEICLDS